MKRKWKLIPSAIRWLLVTLVILTMTAGSVLAYRALTAEVEVAIEECLDFVGASTFNILLYPGETDTVQITVSNLSSVDIEVDLTPTIEGASGLTVDIPRKIIVPAIGEIIIDIDMVASKSAEPGAYFITIDFER